MQLVFNGKDRIPDKVGFGWGNCDLDKFLEIDNNNNSLRSPGFEQESRVLTSTEGSKPLGCTFKFLGMAIFVPIQKSRDNITTRVFNGE